jgi:hypothetical protein
MLPTRSTTYPCVFTNCRYLTLFKYSSMPARLVYKIARFVAFSYLHYQEKIPIITSQNRIRGSNLKMAATNPSQSHRSSLKRKLMRQKQSRRKLSLMKKACEYSRMFEADVCLGIRLRETGQVFILSADASGFWGFLRSQLVCCPVSAMRQDG